MEHKYEAFQKGMEKNCGQFGYWVLTEFQRCNPVDPTGKKKLSDAAASDRKKTMTVKGFECHLNVMAVLPFSSGSRKNIYI